MRGPVTEGWYRHPVDDDHVLRKVVAICGAWVFCTYDIHVRGFVHEPYPLPPGDWAAMMPSTNPT